MFGHWFRSLVYPRLPRSFELKLRKYYRSSLTYLGVFQQLCWQSSGGHEKLNRRWRPREIGKYRGYGLAVEGLFCMYCSLPTCAGDHYTRVFRFGPSDVELVVEYELKTRNLVFLIKDQITNFLCLSSAVGSFFWFVQGYRGWSS